MSLIAYILRIQIHSKLQSKLRTPSTQDKNGAVIVRHKIFEDMSVNGYTEKCGKEMSLKDYDIQCCLIQIISKYYQNEILYSVQIKTRYKNG